MKKALIIVIILIVVAVAGFAGYKLLNKSDEPSTTTTTTTTTETPATDTSNPESAGEAAVITYSDNGFSPDTLTVKSGTTVTIKNTTSHSMQFDSDPHPAHTTNEELNAEVVPAGKSQTFVVKRTGTFGYHNHLNASETGTIIVE